jgi:hypothetical protein
MSVAVTEYKQKVWLYLDRMKPGQRFKIEDLSKDETRDQFVEAIKEFMDSFPYQAQLSFNHDYTEVYKMTPILSERFKCKTIKN